MNIDYKLKKAFLTKIAKPRYQNIVDRENSIVEKANTIKFNSDSPDRFEIPLEAIKYVEMGGDTTFFQLKVLPIIFGSLRGISKSFKGLESNPINPKSSINTEDLKNMEKCCHSLDIGMIGYTKLPPALIFRNKAVLYENTIVLVKEMDKEKINSSPSLASYIEVHKTYRDLGYITIKLANYLRTKGYGAHPVHPLGGAVLTPPLAMQAGLGWQGRHGMIITPKFGPRVRIAAVFTNIQNLPFSTTNEHSWIDLWCQSCGRCIKKCPSSAILENKIEKQGGIRTCIDVKKCFPYFVENYGCSVCIKECDFNIFGYENLKQKTIAKNRS
ncbi:MAG: reductive dehalogenase domain-containing protein [Candidatus Lokiarchaeota archaeon]